MQTNHDKIKARDKKEDNRVSVCTNCRKGIFRGQEYHWTDIGLIHTGC